MKIKNFCFVNRTKFKFTTDKLQFLLITCANFLFHAVNGYLRYGLLKLSHKAFVLYGLFGQLCSKMADFCSNNVTLNPKTGHNSKF